MTKSEYLAALQQKLSALSPADIKGYTDYYAEMIDDRIEEGMTEEDAVDAVGSVEDAAEKILSENPTVENQNPNEKESEKESSPFRKLKAWHIVLIILGAPVWLPLLIAAASVVVSIVVSAVSVIVSMYAACASLGAGAVAGICMIAGYVTAANYIGAVFIAGASLFCAGCCVILFALLFELTKFLIAQCKKIPALVRTAFDRKGEKA